MPQNAWETRPATNRRKTAKVITLPMPLRLCSVGFKSATGVSHSVDVEAETLYEAAAAWLSQAEERWMD